MNTAVLGLATIAAVVVALVVAAAGGVLVAEVRAQDAADAAALAAAHAAGRGAPPPVAARHAASVHGGDVVRCDCHGPTLTVTVRVAVPVRAARLAGIGVRTATSSARLVPAAG